MSVLNGYHSIGMETEPNRVMMAANTCLSFLDRLPSIKLALFHSCIGRPMSLGESLINDVLSNQIIALSDIVSRSS